MNFPLNISFSLLGFWCIKIFVLFTLLHAWKLQLTSDIRMWKMIKFVKRLLLIKKFNLINYGKLHFGKINPYKMTLSLYFAIQRLYLHLYHASLIFENIQHQMFHSSIPKPKVPCGKLEIYIHHKKEVCTIMWNSSWWCRKKNDIYWKFLCRISPMLCRNKKKVLWNSQYWSAWSLYQ